MASRPKRLKIGLHHYSVKYTPDPVTPEGDEVQGYIHYPTHSIQVGTSQHNSVEPAEILLHEAVHGVVTDRALGKLFSSCDEEELFVTSFATGLYAVLRENKGLGEWVSQ